VDIGGATNSMELFCNCILLGIECVETEYAIFHAVLSKKAAIEEE
jgi:hypothetical protein